MAQTGDNGSGDIWPEVDLAQFTWEKPNSDAITETANPLQVAAAAATLIPHVAEVVQGQRGTCTFVPGDKRVV